MGPCRLENFDIAIRGTQAPYSVTCQFDGQSAGGLFNEDAGDPEWRAILTELRETQTPPGNARLTAIGSRLFSALMRDDIYRLWLRADTVAGRRQLRIRLTLQPAAVSALPWELLFDTDRNRLFAASGHTPLVRMQTDERFVAPPRQLRTEPPLRVLIAAPDDPLEMIDLSAHLRVLTELFATLGSNAVCVKSLTGRFDVLTLAQAAQAHNADVLHLIAHGRPDGLLLWRDDEGTFVRSNALRMALERATTLRFVLLNACLAGQSAEGGFFSAVGPQLLQLGIPAVVAMQFEIGDHDAGRFAALLYQELLGGVCRGAIDVAVGLARSSLYALDPDRVTFGTPVLWLNADDGQIFPAESRVTTAQSAVSAPPNDQAPAVPDVAELTRWLDRLGSTIAVEQLPLRWSALGRHWQELSREFTDTLHQLEYAADPAAKLSEVRKLQTDLTRLAEDIRAQTDPARDQT